MEGHSNRAQLGFLLTRRWVGLLAFSILLAITCLQLGRWQLHRLEQRHRANHLITSNASSRPTSPEHVFVGTRPLAHDREYTRVRMTGSYDVADQMLVRNRSLDGVVGYWVLVPLLPSASASAHGAAPALWVNRGWIPAGDSATRLPPVPAPPSGPVTVLGRARPSESAGSKVVVATGQVARIVPMEMAQVAGHPTYDGYLDLTRETPRPTERPRLLPAPETSEGPHLSYAFQWFLFALMALGGYVQLARREVSDQRAATSATPPATPPARPTAGPPASASTSPTVVSIRVDS